MSDIVFVRGLEAHTVIGIQDWERKTRQVVRIDLEMAWDLKPAAAAEDVDKTIDYRAVSKAILAHLEETSYYLVETLAERVSEIVREQFGVPWLRLSVAKPGAVRYSESVGVIIERGERPA